MTAKGTLFLPAFRLSPKLELSSRDRALGIVAKMRILPPEAPCTAMGAVADCFRRLPDAVLGEGVFRVAGWGRHAREAVGGLRYALEKGGCGLLLGVDIYRLASMHEAERLLPEALRHLLAPGPEVDALYPPRQWHVQMGRPPAPAWYEIQSRALDRGRIRTGRVGPCQAMFFALKDVVGLYARELRRDPYRLYGLKPPPGEGDGGPACLRQDGPPWLPPKAATERPRGGERQCVQGEPREGDRG